MTAVHSAEPLHRIRGVLSALGYGEELIRIGFPVWWEDGTREAPLTAFGRPEPQDVTTSILLGAVSERPPAETHREAARRLACPIALIAVDDAIDIWRIGARPDQDRKEDQLVAHAPELGGRLRRALDPDVLLADKERRPALSLLDDSEHDLLAYARRASAAVLSPRVAEAMKATVSLLRRSDPINPVAAASRLVVGAISALMVTDKAGVTGVDELRFAAGRHPQYFDWLDDAVQLEREALEMARDILRANLRYDSVDATVVSAVYEQVMTDRHERKELGIFYTPPGLAGLVCERLPVETIHPDRRVVLDPACGSGTLLLAAHDRLMQATPRRWGVHERRAYVRERLLGADTDEFAVEIARLSLLLNALPAGNGFQVSTRSIDQAPVQPISRPTLVLSNPPWRHTRSREGKRHEVSDDFLLRLLDLASDDGFVTAILPVGFLSSRKSRPIRQEVLRRARVYELWRLPERTFGDSALAPCVLFLEKGQTTSTYLFRRVLDRPSSQRRFERTGRADETLLARPELGLVDDTLLRGPLQPDAGKLRGLRRLDEVATVRQGPPPWTVDIPDRGEFLWLRRAELMPAFGQPPTTALQRVEYPADFAKRSDDGSLYAQPNKLLVSAKRSPANPWRLKVGVDRIGVIPRETLSLVAPFGDRSVGLPALAAILSSSVAACWIDTLSPTLSISSETLASLPVPDDTHWERLAEAGSKILDEELHWAEDRRERLRSAESIVRDAYGLSNEVRAALNRHFAGFVAPEGSVRYLEQVTDGNRRARDADVVAFATPHRDIRRPGTVLGFDSAQVRLWIFGLTEEEGILLNPPEGLPGWLYQPGATFELLGDDPIDGRYVFHGRAWMKDDELLGAKDSR